MSERLREQLALVVSNVERAQQMGVPIWPLNEADTERLVVEPVLRALGYGELDYRKRIQGAGANYPDYFILPATEQQWVLEAKEWDSKLDERCERQAVNYANNNGAQWAVLTNGRAWWVYNTRVAGDLTQQLVYRLDDITDLAEAGEVLSYLSRSSIQGGELDRAYRAKEIRTALVAELRNGNRQIVNAIRAAVGRNLDRHVSNEDVADALHSIIGDLADGVPVAQNPPPKDDLLELSSDSHRSLTCLVDDPALCTGATPSTVTIQGCDAVAVKTWRDVVIAVLSSTGALGKIAIPHAAGPRAKRYFANVTPLHANGAPMKAPREVGCNGGRLYVELHYSAECLLSILADTLKAAGVDPEAVRIGLCDL